MLLKPKEVEVYTKPQEIIFQMLQEENIAIHTSVNILNYRPLQGA